jgi:polysaccharide biosynthesis protein PslH
MKILFVSPFLPSPARFGGQRRLDGLMRELATRHEVSILAFNNTDAHEKESLAATQSYCHEVKTLPNFEPQAAARKRELQLRSLVSRHSFEHGLATRRKEFQVALDEMLERTSYDVVQFEFMQMAPFRKPRRQPESPVYVLDEHNIEYDILKRTAAASSGFVRGAYQAFNWRKLAREERVAWTRFDGVSLTSVRDEQLLKESVPHGRTAVVPNGVDVSAFSVSTGPTDPDSLLFFGAINYFPNSDGVVYFLDHVFPLIRKQRPNASFRILGPGAGPEVQQRSGNGVEILGMVDDVGPHLDRAAAVVVPLRIGGGTRLKIVEALSKGKAVISTRLGAEGIDVVHEQHVLLADQPSDFAEQAERVLANPELAARLGSAGRKLMEDRYSWRGIVARLEEFYQELSAAKR